MAHRSRARKRAAQLSTEQLEAEGYADERHGDDRQAVFDEQDQQGTSFTDLGSEWDDEDNGDEPLPSDTLLALQLLRSQLRAAPQQGALVRVILRSQIYALVHDRTEVDRELQRLSQASKIQVFKLPTATDDYAYMLGDDYCELAAAQLPALTAEGPDEVASQAVEWFLLRAVPACHDIQIMRARLLKLLSTPHRDEVAEREAAGMPRSQAKQQSLARPAHLDMLIRAGLLTRQCSDHFSFAIPGLGPLIKDITDGRKELLQMLRRRQHHSMLLHELEPTKLRSSRFNAVFHIRDCVGRELVRLVDAPGGKLVELPRRRK